MWWQGLGAHLFPVTGQTPPVGSGHLEDWPESVGQIMMSKGTLPIQSLLLNMRGWGPQAMNLLILLKRLNAAHQIHLEWR